MTTILIIEGNSPAKTAAGLSASDAFVQAIPGLSADTKLRIANPYSAPLSTADVEGIDGVIFTGSGEAWSVNAPEVKPQRTAMEMALGFGLPIWGSCNGLQLAAVVLGGAVDASPNGTEIGVARDIRLTKEGGTHPAMAGRAHGFAVPCTHRDEVQRLPEGAQLLAGNAHSPVQAMAYTKEGIDFWGTQYHPEFSAQYIAELIHHKGLANKLAKLVSDLEIAETDMAAAARLGTTPDAMTFEARTRELANWLDHVAARKAITA
jgi:GMP synthase (glutamine-hydrolysing)